MFSHNKEPTVKRRVFTKLEVSQGSIKVYTPPEGYIQESGWIEYKRNVFNSGQVFYGLSYDELEQLKNCIEVFLNETKKG